METQSINQQLDELADLYVDMLSDNEMFNIDESKKQRTADLMSSIRTYLIDYPGELIYEENPASIERKIAVIEFLWNAYDEYDYDIHYDELFGGDNTDFITNFASGYLKRAKMIKPTFISVKNVINNEFEAYFREATEAWLYGCKHAAIIICNSLLEDLLRNKLCLINGDYATQLIDGKTLKANRDFSFQNLKDFSKKEKLLSKSLIKKLSNIQKTRNDMVHNLNTVSDEEAYERIMDTKDIVESLLNKK